MLAENVELAMDNVVAVALTEMPPLKMQLAKVAVEGVNAPLAAVPACSIRLIKSWPLVNPLVNKAEPDAR